MQPPQSCQQQFAATVAGQRLDTDRLGQLFPFDIVRRRLRQPKQDAIKNLARRLACERGCQNLVGLGPGCQQPDEPDRELIRLPRPRAGADHNVRKVCLLAHAASPSSPSAAASILRSWQMAATSSAKSGGGFVAGQKTCSRISRIFSCAFWSADFNIESSHPAKLRPTHFKSSGSTTYPN